MEEKSLNKDNIANKEEMTFEQIDSRIKELSVRKSLLVDESLRSNDVHSIVKAQDYLVKQEKVKQSQFKSFVYSPEHEFYNGMGYKSSLKSISYDLMRAMARTPQINAIIQTRIEQVLNFSEFQTDLQRGGWTIVKKLSRFDDHSNYELKDKDKKEIDRIVNFLENGGDNAKWDMADDFDEFLRKYVKDSLELDQSIFEVERTRGGDIFRYAAKPSDTYRILETIDPNEFNKEKYRYDEVNGYLPIYAQVWRGRIAERDIPGTKLKEQIVFYPWELNFGVRNKSTYIRNNGYGKSELEILVEIITWMLYGMQYNGNFFKQGSNPKGFFTIEGDADKDVVNEFRSSWRQTIAGIVNCLAGDTFILTDNGGFRIDKLFEKNNLDKDINVWTGKKFEKATAIMSEKKKLTKMTLNNGMFISCSPDHRFKIVSKDGIIKWIKRKDIKNGDFVLINKNQVSLGNNLYYKEKGIESDLMEVIGWMIGDGWIGEDKPKKRRGSLYYHSIKERWIAKRHLNILKKYNINSYIDERFYTEQEKNDIIEKFGFKSISNSNLKIQITDSNFYSFLYSIGFKSSKDGKNIPDFLYTINSDYKNSFIKGLFSADGYSNGKVIQLSIVNDNLRHQVKQLLLSEGIRCNNHEGISRYCKLGHQLQDGYRLLIKDRKEFYDRIGFVQSYKNAKNNRTKSYRVLESIPESLVNRYIIEIKKFQKSKYKSGERLRNNYITSKISGIKTGKDKISKEGFISLCEDIDFEVEKDILDFNFEKVIDLENTKEFIQMYDISVHDDNHQFIANGILTHNSHRIPIFEGQSKINWVDMQMTNKDMEFENWNDFLLLIACSVYRIDPQEIGYTFKSKNQLFGQKNQKERIEHSKEKGLKPLLKFVQKQINKYLVSELNDQYEFKFTGIDLEDETTMLDNDSKKITSGFVSMEDMFEKYSNRKFNPEKDTILNPVYVQSKQMEIYGGIDANAAVDKMTGDKSSPPKIVESYEKGENPIMDASLDYIQKNLLT